MLTIKQLNQYNFILAEKLDEPIVSMVNFGGNDVEVIQTHRNKDYYYGSIFEACIGYFKHNKLDVPNRDELPKELLNIKPYNPEKEYIEFMDKELSLDLIKDIVFNEV